jgi:hypothetical protein
VSKPPLYWEPSSHLGAGYALKHLAPQLVGRLPRLKQASRRAALSLGKARMPKLPNPLSAKSPLAPQPAGALVKPPQPAIPSPKLAIGGQLGLGAPPAGSAFPQPMQGGLAARQPVPLMAGAPLNPGLPKLPGVP